MTKKINRYWAYVVLMGLLLIIVSQMQTNWRNYVYPWFKDNKGYMVVSSPQRSAILITDRERARFIRFLDAYLPEDAAIVLPPKTVAFSSQSIMQNFLFPRAIIVCCGDDQERCQKCLSDPDHYILAVNSFPLPEDQPGKYFVSYPEATNSLRGVYIPEEMIGKLSMPDLLAYGKTQPISVRALLIDLLIVGLLFILGTMFVSLAFKIPTWSDLFELSIPLGMGILSWGLFLSSYFGISLTLKSVALLFFGFFSLSLVVYRYRYGIYPKIPVLARVKFKTGWQVSDSAFVLLAMVTIMAFVITAILAIGRGYSTGDDIINWSFKGYAMVDSGTIWAGNRWGGHVLAYPMNIILSIGIFRLADGDVIPGSKLLYILLTFSLLFGCNRFLTRNGVNRIWAISGVLALLMMPLFLFHATTGFANLPFTVYLILGVLYSMEGLKELNNPQILLGGVLLAIAAWTRPEGLFFGVVFLGVIYLLAAFVMKRKFETRLILLSLLPMLIIPGSWMFLMGRAGMENDQIGHAVKAMLANGMSGHFNLEAVGVLAQYAFRTFNSVYFSLLLFAMAAIGISAPLTRWYQDRFRLSLALLDLLAFLLPATMFFVASFDEANFVVFLDQSFDRAYLPALTLTMLVALLAAKYQPPPINRLPDHKT